MRRNWYFQCIFDFSHAVAFNSCVSDKFSCRYPYVKFISNVFSYIALRNMQILNGGELGIHPGKGVKHWTG